MSREATAAAVAGAWDGVDLDLRPSQLAAALAHWERDAAELVTSGQARVVDLTAAYLPAYLTASGVDPEPRLDPPQGVIGVDPDGRDIRALLAVATTGLLWELGRRSGRERARDVGRTYATRTARTAVSDAARGALTHAMDVHPAVTGWTRLTSAQSCQRCVADTGKVHAPAYRLRSHPSCRCGQEPVLLNRVGLRRATPAVVRP